MSDSSSDLSQRMKELVFDCLQKITDIVLLSKVHGGPMQDLLAAGNSIREYRNQAISKSWQKNPYVPITIEILMKNAKENQDYFLIEKWFFSYSKEPIPRRDARSNSVNRRLIILQRTLYCFVRILPGYSICSRNPDFKFGYRIAESDPKSFSDNRIDTYTFPKISAIYGDISLSVQYLNHQFFKVFSPIPSFAFVPMAAASVDTRSRGSQGSDEVKLPYGNTSSSGKATSAPLIIEKKKASTTHASPPHHSSSTSALQNMNNQQLQNNQGNTTMRRVTSSPSSVESEFTLGPFGVAAATANTSALQIKQPTRVAHTYPFRASPESADLGQGQSLDQSPSSTYLALPDYFARAQQLQQQQQQQQQQDQTISDAHDILSNAMTLYSGAGSMSISSLDIFKSPYALHSGSDGSLPSSYPGSLLFQLHGQLPSSLSQSSALIGFEPHDASSSQIAPFSISASYSPPFAACSASLLSTSPFPAYNILLSNTVTSGSAGAVGTTGAGSGGISINHLLDPSKMPGDQLVKYPSKDKEETFKRSPPFSMQLILPDIPLSPFEVDALLGSESSMSRERARTLSDPHAADILPNAPDIDPMKYHNDNIESIFPMYSLDDEDSPFGNAVADIDSRHDSTEDCLGYGMNWASAETAKLFHTLSSQSHTMAEGENGVFAQIQTMKGFEKNFGRSDIKMVV